MIKMTHITAALAVAVTLWAATAEAQFRPGSSPDGGRIRALCTDRRLSSAEQKDCDATLRAAKGSKERTAAKAIFQELLASRQKELDEALRKDPTLNSGRSCGSGVQC